MREDDVLGDGKTQACASAFTRARFIDTIETFKDAGEMFGWNSRAKIADVELHSVIDIARSEFDAAAFVGGLGGIVDEVGEDLEDGVAIGGDRL